MKSLGFLRKPPHSRINSCTASSNTVQATACCGFGSTYRQPSEDNLVLESFSANYPDSQVQTASHTRTTSIVGLGGGSALPGANASSFITSNFEFDSRRNTELGILAVAVNFLFNNQNKIAGIFTDLVQDIGTLVSEVQKTQQQAKLPIYSFEHKEADSESPRSPELNLRLDKIGYSMKAILSKVELLHKNTGNKLQEYENCLRTFDNRSGFTIGNAPQSQERARSGLNRADISRTSTAAFIVGAADQNVEGSMSNLDLKQTGLQFNNIGPSVGMKEHRVSVLKHPEEDFGEGDPANFEEKMQFDPVTRPLVSPVNLEESKEASKWKRPVFHLSLPVMSEGNTNVISSHQNNQYKPSIHTGRNGNGNGNGTGTMATNPSTNCDTVSNMVSNSANMRRVENFSLKKIQKEVPLSRMIPTSEENNMLTHKSGRSYEETSPHRLSKVMLTTPRTGREALYFTTETIHMCSPRGAMSQRSAHKLSNKPLLNELRQKDLVDDSFRSHSDESVIVSEFPNRILRKPDLNSSKDVQMEYTLGIAAKEKAVIKRLMKIQYGTASSYHKADHGKMHQRKYLISAKWWQEWKDFVNFDSNNAANSKMTLSVEMSLYKRPGMVVNKDLVKQASLDDPKAIEYELDLKENLLEHHNYEAVSKQIFEVFLSWYGCDYEIFRVLRPNQFSDGKMYLDLYPKKKFKKKVQASGSPQPGGSTNRVETIETARSKN